MAYNYSRTGRYSRLNRASLGRLVDRTDYQLHTAFSSRLRKLTVDEELVARKSDK